jgi:hypothetical protein
MAVVLTPIPSLTLIRNFPLSQPTTLHTVSETIPKSVVLWVVKLERVLINKSDSNDIFHASRKCLCFTVMSFALFSVTLYFVSLVFCKILGTHWSFTLKMDYDGCGSFIGPK